MGPAEAAEAAGVAMDERGLLGSGPAFERALALNGGGQIVERLGVDQSRSDAVMSVFAADSQPMLAEAFAQVAGLADVVGAVG